MESVRTQEEVEESIRALLFDEEMDTLGQSCIDDGEWDPTLQVNCQVIYLFYETIQWKYFKQLCLLEIVILKRIYTV